ncbi:prolipoprotein diacylglyceryl transferase [Christensenella intestinihominis]|uniref:prolipoprotein diacylglyceryl transferase n=1 Tax=Christensenella intestinihominis TaxID=1851429 RepID=UPI00083466E0|nr:prolipoprotein diacylglyceryl transferase family protein [Christensenella intestinihominis]
MFPVTQIFSVSVSTYAIFIVIGFAVGLLCAFLRRRINGVRADDLVACLFIAAAGALIGGKLFFMVQGFPVFLAHAREEGYTFLEYFMDAGLVYYGGFIGGIVFLILAAKLIKTPVWAMVDTILPSIPLMHAVGRVGCFSAGCCYGIPCDFGVVFDASPIAPHGVRLLPVQLIESACLLVLFFLMLHYGKQKRPPGKVLAFYLVGYGIIRFILEFFRYDAIRGIYGALSISQWISLGLIALGAFFWFLFPQIKRKKTPA